MSFVTDPRTGLQLLELSHVWGLGAPSYPGQEDVKMVRSVKHAQHGVLAWKTSTSLHTGTYMLAPIHLIQRGADLAAISPDRFFGNGVVLDVPKGSYETITAQDLKKAGAVREGDIVVINTGWHHKYSDSLEYYGEAPGLTRGRGSVAGREEVPHGVGGHSFRGSPPGYLHGTPPGRTPDEAPGWRV